MARCYNFFDGLEVYLSKWNMGQSTKNGNLYSWDDEIDETVMKAVYEAEQFHRFSCGRYKNNFEQFKKTGKLKRMNQKGYFPSQMNRWKCWKYCKRK